MPGKDLRELIAQWGLWAIKNHKKFHYAQIRPVSYALTDSMTMDCSTFVSWCYRQAGAGDPHGPAFHYNGRGYTGTLIANGKRISKVMARPGDIVIYGAGTGDHAALIVGAGFDPLTASMGQEGDPSFCRVSQDGRPARFYRYDTTQKWPSTQPPKP